MPFIRVSHYDFEIPAPYSAGHILSAGEAHALNQLFAENIYNTARLKFVLPEIDELPHKHSVLGPETLLELQTRITDYASTYSFKIMRNSRSAAGPYLQTVLEVARQQVRETLGLSLEELPPEEEVKKLAQTLLIQRKAQALLSARLRALDES